MIQAIIGLFGIARGFFSIGGLASKAIGWLTSSGSWFAMALLWIGSTIKNIFIGTAVAFKQVAVYLAAFYLVQMFRKLLFLAFIVPILGFVVNYAITEIAVSSNKTIALLFSEFIASFNLFGPLGHNLLAFMVKMGFFEAISLLLTVMLYTLMARVALTILFK